MSSSKSRWPSSEEAPYANSRAVVVTQGLFCAFESEGQGQVKMEACAVDDAVMRYAVCDMR